jgi:transglutaminase superfamily protein
MQRAQEFYLSHGPMGAPDQAAAELRSLPHDVKELCGVVQGLLVHRDIAPWLYQLKLPPEARDRANIRPIAEVLSGLRKDRALLEKREPRERMPCVCWHFSTLLATILREQGIPARARCGFGAYFTPGRFEDHWVAEYWSEKEGRWVLVDAQLDEIQRNAFQPDFDPLDVPHDRFILAGDAWLQCREGRADQNLFGLSFLNEQGLWWIAANLIRDLAALNRIDMLPWDVWGIMREPGGGYTPEEFVLLDEVARLTLGGDDTLPRLIALYRDRRLQMPGTVFNADRKTREAVSL